MCEKRYGFTYTILPFEAIFDLQKLDMKQPTPEELAKLKEEKEKDQD